MKELIDKAALLDKIESVAMCAQDDDPTWEMTAKDIIHIIQIAEPVEPETVNLAHGYMEKRKDGVLVYWRCTACKKVYYLEEPRFANYCPGCGAKMDER